MLALNSDTATRILITAWGIQPKEIVVLGPGSSLIRSVDQTYVIKQHAAHCMANAKILEQIYDVVGASGLGPIFLPAVSGGLLCVRDGRLYSLQTYCKKTEKHLSPEEAGAFLARLHKALSRIPAKTVRNHFDRKVPNLIMAAKKYGLNDVIPWIDGELALASNRTSQLLHGDLHAGNLIITEKGPFAIDLDSATSRDPSLDVGFMSYRFFGPDLLSMSRLVNTYTNLRPEAFVTVRSSCLWLLFVLVQRILFIRICAGNGCKRWLWDLDNQMRYYREILGLLSSGQVTGIRTNQGEQVMSYGKY